MVMLHLFFTAKFTVAVAHCNFQLRGAASDEDEHFVKMYCQAHQIAFFSERFETNNYASENGISIQMAARELRYRWFGELMRQGNYTRLATAHHQNDVIETVLLNLVHGSDALGLLGIPQRSGSVIRPLLFASRADIHRYAVAQGIAWREDESNATVAYQRNFIRHQVVPLLLRLNQGLTASVESAIEKNKGVAELARLGSASLLTQRDENEANIEKKALLDCSYPAAVLYQMIRGYGFSYTQCKEIIASVDRQAGKQWFSASHRLLIDRDFLIVTNLPAIKHSVYIDETQREIGLGTQRLSITASDKINIISNRAWACVDADRLSFPLLWRSWQPGDVFQPLGMNGQKKISDYLIDEKLSRAEKEKVTVLVSANEIIWVVGYRINDKVKITSSTCRMLCLQLTTI
jgi:tRNA(Ile)-lysidine synthase